MKEACQNSGHNIEDHFEEILEMVKIGSGAKREVSEEKLRMEKIKGKSEANKTHHEVGAKARQTIKELGDAMPEDLPAPEKSARQLEQKKLGDGK